MLGLLGWSSMTRSRSRYPRPSDDRAGSRPGRLASSRVLCTALGSCVVVTVLVTRRLFQRVQVEGASMMPALAHGDRLVVVRAGSPLVGDLVALHDPDEPSRLLVKRVVAVLPAGLEVRGDNQVASRDSRSFGLVAPSAVIGRAVYRYFPPTRVGLLGQFGSGRGTLMQDGPAPEGYRPTPGT